MKGRRWNGLSPACRCYSCGVQAASTGGRAERNSAHLEKLNILLNLDKRENEIVDEERKMALLLFGNFSIMNGRDLGNPLL
ncbi:MAG: hypothetical protein ACI4TK_18935 [Agathobacter sp.]